MKAVNRVEQRIQMPASINASFQGTAAAFQTSLANEPLLILAALVTVYIVLGVLYESYIHPITIISTLPSAGVGALLALMITRTEFSVIALIGIILLIGIVQKNAIMMIDFALQAERNEGKPAEEAIFQACLLRFRPILMTTMAAMLGGLPLALGGGVGAELRMPLGVTIVGGLIFRRCSRSYTVPVIYLYFDRLAQRLKPRELIPQHSLRVQRNRMQLGQTRRELQENASFRTIHSSGRSPLRCSAWRSCWPVRSLTRCCPWPRCPTWISRSSASARDCPAPAPRPWPRRSPRRWSASSAASPASTR